MTINAENRGIKSQTRLTKNMRDTEEETASRSVKEYTHQIVMGDLMILTLTMIVKMVTSFTRGSKDCKRPFRFAIASERKVSLRKCAVSLIVLSTKPTLPDRNEAGICKAELSCASQSGINHSFR
jgi:hypothetical protein